MECRFCFKSIDSRATRCVNCGASWGSFQKWKSVSVIASVLLTVCSLITIAYTGVVKVFEKEKGALIGEFLTVRKDGIHFTVTNVGNRAVTLYDVWITYPIGNETCERQFKAGKREIDNGIIKVVDAKETVALLSEDQDLYSSIPSSFLPEFRANHESYDDLEKKCSIELSYIDYDQKTRQKTIGFPCNPQGQCPQDLTKQSTRTQ